MPGKMLVRIGDSPIFGSGAYADKTGGCSSTGHGESLMKAIVCRQVTTFPIRYHLFNCNLLLTRCS